MNNYIILFLTGFIITQNSLFCMDQRLTRRSRKEVTQKKFDKRTVEDIKSEKCLICYDKLTENQDDSIAILLACGHATHAICYDILKKYRYHACPACRKPLVLDHDHQEGYEEDSCCVGFIHQFFQAGIDSLKHNDRTLTIVARDLTSPDVSWHMIQEKIKNAASICADDHVIF